MTHPDTEGGQETDPAPSASAAPGRYPSPLAAWLGLALLCILMLTAGLNQQIIYLVVEPLKESLSLSDTQIGALGGFALTLVSALAILPLGWLVDRVNRLRLLAACIAIWSASTVGFALAQSFEGLFGFAMGIAVGEAVLGPIMYSLIADMFPRDKWVRANLIMYIAGRLGGFASLAFAGTLIGFAGSGHSVLPPLIAQLAPWRIALILSTLTAPVLIILTLMIRLRSGATVKAQTGGTSQGLFIYFQANARALVGVFLGFGIVFAANGGAAAWFPAALQRGFGAKPTEIGVTMGIIGGCAAAFGVAAAALLERWLRRKVGDLTPMVMAQFATAGTILATPVMLLAPDLTAIYTLYAAKTFLLTVCLSLSPAVLQMLAPSHLRGRVIAVGGLITIIFSSMAPLTVGMLSDTAFHGPKGLMTSIVVVSTGASLIGLLFMMFGASSLPSTFQAAAAADREGVPT